MTLQLEQEQQEVPMDGAKEGPTEAAETYLERAEVYLTLGEVASALADAIKAYDMKMDSPRVYLVLGDAYMQSGEKDRAVEFLQAGCERYPDCVKLKQVLEAAQDAKTSQRPWKSIAMVAVGATAAGLLAGPVVVGAAGMAGFTSSGIAAGSFAASWMSSAAIANGGGIAAGSAVAICQSIGATSGIGAAATGVASAVGGIAGFFASRR